MAFTTTSLAAPLGKNDLTLTATSASGATVGGFAKVNSEYMTITAVSGSRVTVRTRGDHGTAARDHAILSPLVFGLTSDLPERGATQIVATPMMDEDVITVGANTAVLPAPVRNTIYVLTKATALASTVLADPKPSQTGLRVTFTSTTTAAHVITTVNGHDGTTGAHTTWTLAAFPGAGFTLMAVAGKWNLVCAVATTPS